jgi:hypothetical protein
MSTDFPNAWGRPPFESDPFEDVWDNSVADTATSVKVDLEDIIKDAIREEIKYYFEIPEQWRDDVLDIESDFIEEVIDTIMKDIKINH